MKAWLESLALLIGTYGGCVVIPSVGVDRAAMDEMAELLRPAGIAVRLVLLNQVGNPAKVPGEALAFEPLDAGRVVASTRLVLR